MSSDSSTISEYFKLNDEYVNKFGTNTILLMQVGAFFEIYGLRSNDNTISHSQICEISKICNLNISDKKNMYKNLNVVMAGFRDYSLDKYLPKIVDANFHAVVYDQEKTIKGITRNFAGAYSPGTYLSNENTQEDNITNNIMCLWFDKIKVRQTEKIVYGISIINIFTGKSYIFEYEIPFFFNPTTFDELERCISVFSPSEILFISPFDSDFNKKISQFIGIEFSNVHYYSLKDNRVLNCMKQTYTQLILSKHFGEDSLQHCEEFYSYSIATQSLCFLLDFIEQHNTSLIRHIHMPYFNNVSTRVILANHTLKQLNIINDQQYKGTLSSVLNFTNKCCSSIGKRLYKYQLTNPCFDSNWLNSQYDFIDSILNCENCINDSRKILCNIYDIEKYIRLLIIKKIYPSHIFQLYESIKNCKNLIEYLRNFECFSLICNDNSIFQHCEEFIEFIDKHFIIENCKKILSSQTFDINIIQPSISNELDSLLNKQEINEKTFEGIYQYFNNIMKLTPKDEKTEFVKKHETEKSGISLQLTKKRAKSLKEIISKNKNETITIEGSSFILNEVDTHSANSSNDEISFPLLRNIIKNRLQFQEKINKTIMEVFFSILTEIELNWLKKFDKICDFIGNVDVNFSKAYFSKKYNYCRPKIDDNANKSYVNIEGLRHCLIEHIQTNEIYVKNDLYLGFDDQQGMLLYGTNAVGKTSLIRAMGICVILAQSGMFVPCSSFIFKPYTAIYSRILGNDNLFKGLSTFAVEISELRVILRNADENSLILGDEVCSGTETESALSIFVTALMNIYSKNSTFIFATHFHEITNYDEIKSLANLAIYHMHVIFDRENDCLVYDRKLKKGSGTRMYGLEVCKSLYLDEAFLEKTYELRNKYFPQHSGNLNHNTSTYNAKKVRGICENCKETLSTEIHHMIPQNQANSNGFIENGVHKNHPANLMALCEKCHLSMHYNGDKVLKRKKTTKGTRIVEQS